MTQALPVLTLISSLVELPPQPIPLPGPVLPPQPTPQPVPTSVPEPGSLALLAAGPTGYGDAFPGFDMLLFLNLSRHDLPNPELGVLPGGGSGNFTQTLLAEGFLNDPAFGGSGALTLASLGVGDVYATLAPTFDTVLNAQAGAGPLADASLADGGVLYLTATPVPEPSSMALLGFGVPGMLGLARVGRRGAPARDAGIS